MFPVGDENRGQRLTPVVNYSLIALNILVFLYEISRSDQGLLRFIYRWGAIPDEISHGNDLITLVTSQFLHGGWLHIAGNMLFLWVFGDNIEDTMGHIGYLIFYLLCGVAAGLGQVVIDTGSHTPLVGASGAISGVLAAYIVLFPRGTIRTLILLGWIPLMFAFPAWFMIGYWIVMQFINGFFSLGVKTAETGSAVAYFAHIGGFIAGLVLVQFFRGNNAHQRQVAALQGFNRVRRIR